MRTIPMLLTLALGGASALTQLSNDDQAIRAAQANAQANQAAQFPVPRHVDPVKLRRDANELSALAGSVPPDIKAVNQGVLPKDLLKKLKRIETLSNISAANWRSNHVSRRWPTTVRFRTRAFRSEHSL